MKNRCAIVRFDILLQLFPLCIASPHVKKRFFIYQKEASLGAIFGMAKTAF